jgi:mRNA interferase MazF
VKIERGAILKVDFDPTLGHEQRGIRPAVLVSNPAVIAHQRFPLLCVVPVTSTAGQGALYPKLEPGASGLQRTSFAMIDQLRSVDKQRVRRVHGKLSGEELDAIDEGLRLYLSLPALF